jgi:hypothetical protein
MKKLMLFLLLMLFLVARVALFAAFVLLVLFATSANAQTTSDTLYKKQTVITKDGKTLEAYVPYVITKNDGNNKEKSNERYDNSRRGYVLDKTELKQDHELDMEKEQTKQIKAKADGGKWEKGQSVIVANGNGYYNDGDYNNGGCNSVSYHNRSYNNGYNSVSYQGNYGGRNYNRGGYNERRH